MNIDLSTKKILITGASRGIGFAITEALLISGATVVGQYRNTNENLNALKTKFNGRFFSIQCDLALRNATERLFKETMDCIGGLDVVINNAGIAIQSDPVSNTQDFLADWEHTMQINLTSAAQLSMLAIPVFEKQERGIIINIASRAAFRGDTREFLAYAASKGGMVAFTRSIARAYGKSGITAFIVAPGFTKTDMAQQFIDEYGEEYASSDIALKKLTEPRDIAPLIVFLSSGLAEHATGATFDVNAASYVH